MNESKPLPSRRRPCLARIVRWALLAMLALWLGLIALGVGLHGLIVPRIGEWRSQVETWASAAVGAPVRVAAIVARSEGLVPTIELQALQVLDASGEVALSVPKVVLGVSVRSLLRGGIEQLYAEGVQLHVQRSAAGLWHVAGLAIPADGAGDGAGLEWLLAQPEVVLRNAQVHIADAQAQVADWRLEDVQVLLRGGRRPAWQVSAKPVRADAAPGAATPTLAFSGQFRPAWLSSAPTWQRWSGQLYAQLDMAHVSALPWPQQGLVQQLQADGPVRVWLDVQRGAVTGVTADVAWPQLIVDWREAGIAPLALRAVTGRVHAQRDAQAWSVALESLSLETPQGQRWAPGQLTYRPVHLPGKDQGHELQLQQVDLQMAAELAQRVPGLQAWHATLQQLMPQGVLQQLHARWQPGHYQVQGQMEGLGLQAQPRGDGKVGVPGVQGLSATFTFTERGGHAALAMTAGALDLPGVFAQPQLPLDTLQASVRWARAGSHWRVHVEDAQFHNADAAGTLQAQWHTGHGEQPQWPGFLDLKGQLHQADGAQVHRYLPLQVAASARAYVRDSVKAGRAQGVRFEVAGNLQKMPFRQAQDGRFYIEAPLRDVVYDYVPHGASAASTWPRLEQLSGTLVVDGLQLEVREASTAFAGIAGLQMQAVSARIPDLMHPQVHVQAQGQASVQSMLDFVRQSPVQAWTGHALEHAQAKGTGALQFTLDLPVSDLRRSQVQGALTLQGNSLEMGRSIPPLQALEGEVAFSHEGFALHGVRGQGLGGAVQLSGGMAAGDAGVRIRGQGVATAEGLRDAPWPVLQAVAQHAQGQAMYDVDVQVNAQGLQVQVQSPLQGLSLALPAPLHKARDVAWPLDVNVRQGASGSQAYQVALHERVDVRYEWANASAPPKGMLQVGQVDAALGLPARGVHAQVVLPALNVDEWLALLPSQAGAAPTSVAAATALDASSAVSWMPQHLRVQVGALSWQQRQLGPATLAATHQQGRWSGRVQAQLLSGDVAFYPADAQYPGGRIFGRLQHLHVPKAQDPSPGSPPPAAESASKVETLPALDIQVEDVQVAGWHLGKLQMLAINRTEGRQREWWLERFDITTPEASWTAHGRWGAAGRSGDEPRETSLTFGLDVRNAGQLLERLEMPGVIQGGQGRIAGLVQWVGSPLSPDRASMQGQMQVDVGKGQFLKVEPGAGKLLSVLSLQSLPRRAVLDFRDVFSQGFAFDWVRGDVHVRHGVAMSSNLQMKGLNAAVFLQGQAHLVQQTQDLQVVVVPEINAMTASLAASLVNPVVGLGTFLAQWVLRGPVVAAATRSFHVHGSWSDPAVERVALPAFAPLTQGDTP